MAHAIVVKHSTHSSCFHMRFNINKMSTKKEKPITHGQNLEALNGSQDLGSLLSLKSPPILHDLLERGSRPIDMKAQKLPQEEMSRSCAGNQGASEQQKTSTNFRGFAHSLGGFPPSGSRVRVSESGACGLIVWLPACRAGTCHRSPQPHETNPKQFNPYQRLKLASIKPPKPPNPPPTNHQPGLSHP